MGRKTDHLSLWNSASYRTFGTCDEFENTPLQNLRDAFPKAILLGVVRYDSNGIRSILNPPDGFVILKQDRLILMARSYRDTEPLTDTDPHPMQRGVYNKSSQNRSNRHILILGWNDKIPALIHEFDNYENESCQIDILSTIPLAEREQRLRRYGIHPRRVKISHFEGDYAAPSDLKIVQPEEYDNVIIVGCDWLNSKEEADARTILGHLLLRRMIVDSKKKPDIILELLDPDNHELFQGEKHEVIISPLILSHMLAQVALRADLNVVFHEIFSSGGVEIFIRTAKYYDLINRELSFRDLQEEISLFGETLLGFIIHGEYSIGNEIELNPHKNKTYMLRPEDDLIVLTASH